MGERRGLTLLDKIQPAVLILSIVIGLFIAQRFPQVAESLGWVVTFGIFIVIYNVFIGTELREVLETFRNLKPTLIALFVNFILVPPYAWFLGYIFLRDYTDVWVGLILYLITPCIGWYLIFTDLARGNVPLGVSLLAWNVFLQIALMPIYLYFLAGRIIFIDLIQILRSVGIFLVLPFTLGWMTRRFVVGVKGDEYFHKSIIPSLSIIKFSALVLVIIAMFASQGSHLLENPFVLILMALPTLTYFFSIFTLSLLLGKMFGLSYGDTALIAFTTTARNSEASVAIAISAFPANPLIALVVAIGPSIELPILVILLQILLWIRRYWTKTFLNG